MKKVLKFIDLASKLGAGLSSILMLLIVILIFVEIVLRTFFNSSTFIADEYSAYFFVGVVMMGLSYTFKENGHIRITIITSRLPKNLSFILEIISLCIVMLVLLFSIYHSALMVYDGYILDMRADTVAETKLFIPQIFVILGFILFFFQLVATIYVKFKGDKIDN